MRLKGIKTLQIIAIVIQLVSVVAVIGMTIMQSTIKQLYTNDSAVIEYQSIPINALVQTITMLLIYMIGCVVMSQMNAYTAKAKAVVFVVIACVFQIILQYATWVNHIIAGQGVVALASYASLSNVITLIIAPFVYSAFALFCIAGGRYYWLGDKGVE